MTISSLSATEMLCFSNLPAYFISVQQYFVVQGRPMCQTPVLSYAIKKKKSEKKESKCFVWLFKTKFHFKQRYFLFKGNALKNESIKAALLYEKQQVRLTAGFLCERCEEPKVDRCCKLLNSCCSYILEIQLVRKIQGKYCTTFHSVYSRNLNFPSPLVQNRQINRQGRVLPGLWCLSLSAGFVLSQRKGK